MTVFERVPSGIVGIDKALDNIRLGDNVVWQVSQLEEFQVVLKPYVTQAIMDKRKLIYIQFAKHEPMLEVKEGLQIFKLDPSQGFEMFTVCVHEIITTTGCEAFYIFDCLSDLQEAWSTDLMMGNFFRVICPYLFQLNTVAYFPILRGMHSFEAIARIRETTQLFLDIYKDGKDFYLHPLKVSERYSGTMFQPHKYEQQKNEFVPLLDRLSVSKFYATVDADKSGTDQNLDAWDRYFATLKLLYVNRAMPRSEFMRICKMMMTRDDNMAEMIEAHFSPRDYFMVRDRMIGTGMIGGKACGMLLARKMVHIHLPELAKKLEPHDSYYVGSDVFYTYIVTNNCWKLRIQQRAEREEFSASAEFGERLRRGKFPENIREQFRRMLDYFGQSPIIVRSSSFLEDGFGNAFAGKYKSIFCVNGGDMEERLSEFEEAVKMVYASTMDPSALEYRHRRGLLDKDEQMALLVQRVSGSRYEKFFMPVAAGVGFSYNAYKWQEEMDPKAGMLRVVMGLGTRAVNRTSGDYPRLISLDMPKAGTWSTVAEHHRYSQHHIDVLDIQTNKLCTKRLEEVTKELPAWQKKIVLSHDTDAESILQNRGNYREIFFADCEGLTVKDEFVEMMKQILHMLEEQYGNPVDIEFAVNGSEEGEFVVNLLQCRSLQIHTAEKIEIPKYKDSCILFDLSNTAMGRSRKEKIDVIILVDPQKYYDFPYAKKYEVVRKIGEINQYFKADEKQILLIVPGRIGTSSPELGLPVTYADISSFQAICEVSYNAAGYMPELSYGSHMFQDLVEADIFYGAILEDKNTRLFQPDILCACTDLYEEIGSGGAKLQQMICVYDVSEMNAELIFDMGTRHAVCTINELCVH